MNSFAAMRGDKSAFEKLFWTHVVIFIVLMFLDVLVCMHNEAYHYVVCFK